MERLAPSLPRPVRVLCVPCSTGEEPAGAAMALLDAGLAPGEFRVDAVDACPEALALARLGRFGPRSLRGPLPEPCPWLRREGDELALAPEALGAIRFFEGDVLEITAWDKTGRELCTWSWPIHLADYYASKYNHKPQPGNKATFSEQDSVVALNAGSVSIQFNEKNGQILSGLMCYNV